MQQRQPRLGDILDDYCPRERRVTNHVVVAMVDADVKQTRCSTCDAEHEYKHAKVPRQRRKAETPAALYAQVASGAPKRIAHEPPADVAPPRVASVEPALPAPHRAAVSAAPAEATALTPDQTNEPPADPGEAVDAQDEDEGPVHRPLIRASLPRSEGQPPPTRPLPEFTIRQPGGRQNRFRPRHQQRAGASQPFQGNRSNGKTGGGGPSRGGAPRPGGESRVARRHGPGPGRKRSK